MGRLFLSTKFFRETPKLQKTEKVLKAWLHPHLVIFGGPLRSQQANTGAEECAWVIEKLGFASISITPYCINP